MTIATLSWPEAVVGATTVAAIALVLSVLIWSIFRTGQTAIRQEAGERKLIESLRTEVEQLRAQFERSGAPRETERHAGAESLRPRGPVCAGLPADPQRRRESRARATASSTVKALPCSRASAKAGSSSCSRIAASVWSFILASQGGLAPIPSNTASEPPRSRAAIAASPTAASA
jgi:hypothetical protein